MKLSEKQFIFTKNVAKLINYIFDNGYYCTFGEVFRTPQQAEWNAEHGLGIKNSLHCSRLAVDLNIFDQQGALLNNHADYQQFGKYWETLNPVNRWGGNFTNLDDIYHFEMQNLGED